MIAAAGSAGRVRGRRGEDLRDTVDKWAAQQADEPSRSEAIRRLVELGLSAKTKPRPTERPSTALVADLAAEAIDSLGPKVKAPASPVGKPGRRLRAQVLAT